MIWFVLFIIVAVLSLASLGVRATLQGKRKNPSSTYDTETWDIPKWPVFVGLAVAGLFLILSTTYTQGVGEAKVLKNMTGEIVGTDTTEGLGFKAPWVDGIDYDIRNQQASFVGDGNGEENGKKVDGPQITVRDAKGVASDFDVSVRYSIREDRAQAVFEEYGPQEAFESRLIFTDIRSVVRNAPATYSTIDMLNKREDIERGIFDDLVARWEKEGVQVESVALREIRPPADVSQSFADAQNAQTQVVKAQAELEATKISSQQKVVQAEAEAKANSTLNASLSDNILRQRYLDTLKELAAAGNLVMVPADNSGTFNITPKQ